MRRPLLVPALLAAVLLAPLLGAGAPALADHNDPTTLLSPVVPQGATGALTQGAGTWKHLANLGPMQGTDIEPFTRGGASYVSTGTLGQAPNGTPGFVGQRIVQLTDATGAVLPAPKVVGDHGSSRCQANSSATGLQHDVQAVPSQETQLLVDTTDAVGRCHDTPGGGLELIDVSGLGTPGFAPREIGLVRLNGLSHTVTADPQRPGILYNNGADFGTGSGKDAVALNWTDVVDVRSCLGLAGRTLDEKRAACRPTVTRFPYQADWTSKVLPDGTLTEPASCHDITAAGGRLYCAGLNGTALFDTKDLLDPRTKQVAGTPLPCRLVDGTATGAKVTDCALRTDPAAAPNPPAADALAAYAAAGRPAATGIRFLGTVNHPGRACGSPSVVTCNTNTQVRSDEGVAVSHEADPTPDGKFMMVTDERGGGVVPPGATCAPGLDNPVGNGGLHVFDVSDPAKPTYALTPDGDKAVYIGTSPTPSPTFCTIHVIEQVPGEARIIAAYYDGGTKIVDYEIDDKGRWTFEEVASYRLPGANTWASEVFSTRRNADGTTTYFFVSSSFALGEGTARGLDVFSWTGPANPLRGAGASGSTPATARPGSVIGDGAGSGVQGGDAGGTGGSGILQPLAQALPASGPDRALLLLSLVLLPLALRVRTLRRRLVRLA